MRTPSELASRTMARFQSRQGKLSGRGLREVVSDGVVKGAVQTMGRRIVLSLVLLVGIYGQPAAAQGLLSGVLSNLGSSLNTLTSPKPGVIVRTNLGPSGLQLVCLLHGCSVVGNLDGNIGQVFLVRPVNGLLPNLLANVLRLVTGILDAEPDQVLNIPPNPTAPDTSNAPPAGLWDTTPVNYYGAMVTDGYVNQPAAQIVQIPQAHSNFNVSGAGIVADIDTGVDPNHPALQGVLLQGYDFTRNQPGGSEMNDVSMTAPPPCDSCSAAYVNQHTAAMLDQHTAHMLDGNGYEAFGHGTMVLGVVHLVAPTAKLLPLKAFGPDGNGSLSNIIAAVYYAVQNHANVINMSFDLTQSSTELSDAINYANQQSRDFGRLGRQRRRRRSGLSRRLAEPRDGSGLDEQSGSAFQLFQLRRSGRLRRRSRRRCHHHLPVRTLRRRMGHFVQLPDGRRYRITHSQFAAQ